MNPSTRFTFDAEIHAEGGFGKIHKGRDHILERDIAVKVISPTGQPLEPTVAERFRREARVLAALSHPNIPSIYDVQFDDEGLLILFQFIQGRNLQQIIEEDGPCSPTQVRHWFIQIASALEHAHSLGIIHRDIKPSNIIITENRETAYLVDFGIALNKEDTAKLTESGFVIGTSGYMSQEQVAGEILDPRTDIYSLGITLYEVLAGRRFPVGDYDYLSVLNEAIPSQIDELIRDCISSREARVASAKDFASRMQAASYSARPLSEILAHGRLSELASALGDLDASEFMQLPAGQRALILAKVEDVVASDDDKLIYAGEELLQLMIVRGLYLADDDYKPLIEASVRWAFVKRFGAYEGSNRIRDALEQSCHSARGGSHNTIANTICAFFESVSLPTKADWYLHTVRQIITTLLANATCQQEVASRLVKLLREVNRAQREGP